MSARRKRHWPSPTTSLEIGVDLAVDSALVSLLLRPDVAEREGGAFASEIATLGLRRSLAQASRADEVAELDSMLLELTAGRLRDVTVGGLGERTCSRSGSSIDHSRRKGP